MQGIMESVDHMRVKNEIIRKAKQFVQRQQNCAFRMVDVFLNSNQLTQLTVDVL